MSEAGLSEAGIAESRAARSLGPSGEALQRLKRNPVAILSGGFLLLLVLAAVLAPVLAPYDYDALDTRRYSSLPAPPDRFHPLGADSLGGDVLSRLLYGARVSLGVSAVVVLIELLIGISLGLIAGYRRGRADMLLMRLTDVMFAFPDILLAILLAAIVRSGNTAVSPTLNLLTLFFALGVVGWPGMARLVRGQALALREKEFIESARAAGIRESVILTRHLLPNLISPIIVQATQDIAGVILAESTLSFLNIGVQPPFPSWGRMILGALDYKESFPLLLLVPSAALALTVTAFNFFGDALRDAMDPRMRV